MLGLGIAGLGVRWVCWPKAPALTPPLVPLLPTGWPRPRWRLCSAGAAAFPRPPALQPQTQVQRALEGGWDLGGLGGTGLLERDGGVPASLSPGSFLRGPQNPLLPPIPCPHAGPDTRADLTPGCLHPHSMDSERGSQLLREDSEVFKMLQENREGRVAPRQSSSFRLLQEALEAEERGEAWGGGGGGRVVAVVREGK